MYYLSYSTSVHSTHYNCTMSPDEMCYLLNNEVDDDGCVVKGFVDEEDIHTTSYRCPTIICYHLQDIM